VDAGGVGFGRHRRGVDERAPPRHLDLPALLVDRYTQHLAHGRWRLGVLGRAEAEVIEDLLDGDLVVEVGNDLELPPALATRERVGMGDLRNEAYAEFGIRLTMLIRLIGVESDPRDGASEPAVARSSRATTGADGTVH